MALKFGKAEIARVIEAIDQDHETAEDAAKAALETMSNLFEKRCKFVVVGQLSGTRDRPTIPASDPEAIKLALGFYSTEGDARSAADGMWSSTKSGDQFRAWVLNVHHGTPADLHAERRRHYQELEAKQAEAARQRMLQSIEKHRLAAEERRLHGCCANCEHHKYEHRTLPVGIYPCGMSTCDCEAWVEPPKRARGRTAA